MENYKYPSKDEWIEVSELFPEIIKFGFSGINDLALLLERKKTIKEVHLLQNLSQWDSLLNKKIWNLRQSFVNAIVNYNRGIAINTDDYKNQMKVIQLLQYEFYCEMTFYYLISIRDIILQIINLAFGLGLSERTKRKSRGVGIATVKEKLEMNDTFGLLDIVKEMMKGFMEASEIRNSMTHGFSKLESDRRSSISNEGRTYNAGKSRPIDHDKHVKILKKSIEALNDFFKLTREKLIQIGYTLEDEV